MGFLLAGCIVLAFIGVWTKLFYKKNFFSVYLALTIAITVLSTFIPFGESKGIEFDSYNEIAAVLVDSEEHYIEQLNAENLKCITTVIAGIDEVGNPIMTTKEHIMSVSRTQIVRNSDVKKPILVINKQKWSKSFWSFYADLKDGTNYYVIYLPG